MDPLTWRPHTTLPQPSIPYLCDDAEDAVCDNIEKLQDWPSVMCWDLDDESSVLKSARRCQSWLFFGLLHILTSISGRTFATSDYVSQNSGRQAVDTTKLPGLLDRVSRKLFKEQWMPRVIHTEKMTREGSRFYNKLSSTIPNFCRWSTVVVQKHEETVQACDVWTSEVYTVFLSTMLLIEQVYDLASHRGFHHDEARAHLTSFVTSTRGLAESLAMIGQCPSTISRNKLLPSSAFRLLSLPTDFRVEHSACSRYHCASLDVDHPTYVPKHAQKCKGQCCRMNLVKESDLCEIVARGAIPLVQSRIGWRGELFVRIVDGTGIEDFAAISHVWAGGLGNFDANGHYHCQLKQIHDDLTRQFSQIPASPTCYYWLDTLCIPVSDENLKVQALKSMVQIYARAQSVLVIDPYLSSINTETLSIAEIDLAMVCSPWMNRSWTFQEGALAFRLLFRFADRLLSFEELDFRTSLMQQTSIQRLWSFGVDAAPSVDYITSSSETFERWLGRNESHVNPNSRLLVVWNELLKRSTSKSEDIAAIMAIFMDCNPREILDLPPSQRTQAIIATQTMLPVDILFSRVQYSSTWSPIPPDCRQGSAHLYAELGDMMYERWGVFKVPQLHFTRLLKSRQPRPDLGRDYIYDLGLDACLSIVLDTIDLNRHNNQYLPLILLLREGEKSSLGYRRGIYFDLVGEDENGIYLEYGGSFDYRRLECADGQHEQCCRGPTTAVFEPFDVHITPKCPMKLDMRIQCDQLQWSSSQYYPVFIANIERTRLLSTFQPVATASWFVVYAYSCAQLGILGRCFGFFPAFILVYIAYMTFTLGRSYLLALEVRYLYSQASSKLRETVSSSFCPNHRTSSVLCRGSHTRVSTALASIYGGLFLASAIGTVATLRQSFATASWPVPRPFYEVFVDAVTLVLGETTELCSLTQIPVTFAKIVCKTVFFELCARSLFVALTPKDVLWDAQPASALPSKIFTTSLVRWQSDPRYLLITASSRFFFTPFLIAYTAGLWAQWLKKFVHRPTANNCLVWFGAYTSFYDRFGHVIAHYNTGVHKVHTYIQDCLQYVKRKYNDLKRKCQDIKEKLSDPKRMFNDPERTYNDLMGMYNDLVYEVRRLIRSRF